MGRRADFSRDSCNLLFSLASYVIGMSPRKQVEQKQKNKTWLLDSEAADPIFRIGWNKAPGFCVNSRDSI